MINNTLPTILLILGIIIIIYGVKQSKTLYISSMIGGILLIITSFILYVYTPNLYRDYLTKVYPAMNQHKSSREYEKLYNSLGWYYQCCNESNTNILSDNGVWKINGSKIVGPMGENANILRYIPDVNDHSEFSMGAYPTVFKDKIHPQWNKMPCCSGKYILPKPPLGNLYDWFSLQYFNVPVINISSKGWKFAGSNNNSNRHRDISTFASQSAFTTFQGYPLQKNSTIANISPNDPLGINDGIPPGLWAGPGPFYAGGRAIMRAIYYPNGPQFNYEQKQWTLGNSLDEKTWLNQYLTKDNMKMQDSNTKKLWLGGFTEGEYMEIGHVQQIPGMVQSTGYWFNYFGSGGTGVFYKVGKTPKVSADAAAELKKYIPQAAELEGCSPRNKAHALFTLLWEVKNTKTLPQESGSYWLSKTYTNGSELLRAFYGTDDPWFITMWHCNGWAPKNSNKSWSDFDYAYNPQGKPLPDWTADSTNSTFVNPLSWSAPPWLKTGSSYGIGPNTKLIIRQVDSNFIQTIGKLSNQNVNYSGGVDLVSFYGLMNSNDGVLYGTLCAFLLQAEFGDDPKLTTYVTPPKTYADGTHNTQPNLMNFPKNFPSGTKGQGVGSLTEEGMKYSLAKGFMGNWFYDRVSNGVAFDESMNYFACVLGYETIQMTCNTNTSGFWAYENIFTGFPTKEDKIGLPPNHESYNWHTSVVKERKYPYIKNTTYIGPYVSIFNGLFGTRLSQRDPFDLTKSIPCYNIGGFDCNKTPGVKCTKGKAVNREAVETSNWDNYFEGQCTVEQNIGMQKDKNTAQVLWDPNNFCHQPWGLKDYGSGGVMWGQQTGFAHSYCQSDGDEPTLSSIWSNVPYGGVGYGDGIVTPKSDLVNN